MFECDICGKAFGYKQDMNKHIQAVHSKTKDFKCKTWNKAFACKGYLTKHLNTALHKKNAENM